MTEIATRIESDKLSVQQQGPADEADEKMEDAGSAPRDPLAALPADKCVEDEDEETPYSIDRNDPLWQAVQAYEEELNELTTTQNAEGKNRRLDGALVDLLQTSEQAPGSEGALGVPVVTFSMQLEAETAREGTGAPVMRLQVKLR